MVHATHNHTPAAHGLLRRLPGATALAELVRLDRARYPYLLASANAGPELARYDILFAFPGDTLQLGESGLSGSSFAGEDLGFLAALDNWWAAEGLAPATENPDGLPFAGGWFLYLGYELAGEIEPTLELAASARQPAAFATRIPAAVINDRQTDETILVAEAGHEQLLATMLADIERLPAQSASAALPSIELTEEEPEHFLQNVRTAKDHIRAGDIFQANLSRLWTGEFAAQVDPVDLYLSLCATNPSPFGGLLVRDDFAVVSSSPERLVRRQGNRLDTRPIAGTRPRRALDNDGMPAELLANPKERAEHIMLIDLERNDLGRVCAGGTVRVDEFMIVESYSHVHHIVSNVTGSARDGLTPGQLIAAVFPGGTITGCPKVRCMEIISELEGRPRGAYTGSMGFLNRNGDCDLNILIRSMTLRGGELELAAGSGIVADSEPENELSETRAKAKGMLLALGAV